MYKYTRWFRDSWDTRVVATVRLHRPPNGQSAGAKLYEMWSRRDGTGILGRQRARRSRRTLLMMRNDNCRVLFVCIIKNKTWSRRFNKLLFSVSCCCSLFYYSRIIRWPIEWQRLQRLHSPRPSAYLHERNGLNTDDWLSKLAKHTDRDVSPFVQSFSTESR